MTRTTTELRRKNAIERRDAGDIAPRPDALEFAMLTGKAGDNAILTRFGLASYGLLTPFPQYGLDSKSHKKVRCNMTRKLWLGLAAVIVIACALGGALLAGTERGRDCVSNHTSNLVPCLLAPTVAVTVTVTGNVDEVTFLLADQDAAPVARIQTNGQDTTETVRLSTLSRYYFVIRKGAENRQSRPVGFETTQSSAHLTIRSLNEWEGW